MITKFFEVYFILFGLTVKRFIWDEEIFKEKVPKNDYNHQISSQKKRWMNREDKRCHFLPQIKVEILFWCDNMHWAVQRTNSVVQGMFECFFFLSFSFFFLLEKGQKNKRTEREKREKRKIAMRSDTRRLKSVADWM